MADAAFEGSWEAYRDLISFLKEHGCSFFKGSLVREREQIFWQPSIEVESDIGIGNHLWFITSPEWTIEPMGVRIVSNIHQGKMFSLNRWDGGPYLELYAFKRENGSMHISIGYNSAYRILGAEARPSDELKKFYKKIIKFLIAQGCKKV